MAKREADWKQIQGTEPGREGWPNVMKPRRTDPEAMVAPVPWSLDWCEDGELAPQDRFDLLQTLVLCETSEAQLGLITAIESLSLRQVSVMHTDDVTGMCA
ncbi:hypothetical protein VB734_09755 [Synechococcus sp. BA-124 BA4]|nr:hypothetical protein [Synechococcus sp. BA-124 BA4]MEA5400323.1 hypothetical protein [Synechococcus sp. BA-124 BA4]